MEEEVWIKILSNYIPIAKPLSVISFVGFWILKGFERYYVLKEKNLDIRSKQIDVKIKEMDFEKKHKKK